MTGEAGLTGDPAPEKAAAADHEKVHQGTVVHEGREAIVHWTTIGAVPVTPLTVTLIVATPRPTAVSRPAWLTWATAVLLLA